MPPAIPPENSKPYHHGALREACLEEGAKLLAESGVAKFSLREVARRLGVTPTALYHHFPDKEDLLGALAYEGLLRFQEVLTQAVKTSGDRDRLSAMGSAYIEFFLERPYYMDLLFRPENKADHHGSGIWANTFQLMENALIERGMDPAEAPYFGIWLWSGVHGLAGMVRDGILGHPENCGPDSPPPFLLSEKDLLKKVIPFVGHLIGSIPASSVKS
jgi:AcrR family transcriptional regulator